MKYYHGSQTANIKLITPNVSNHSKAFVYITTDPVVAAFYMVKANFYTYGFKKGSSIPVYTEYYKNALKIF
ncbi:hypothetical protein IAI10_23350 [Clostridium sp. 19966]|uniref:hypothetical protein n=1 Tax=Clostridium sp. 19966 TaxID=2768166 RepID=UPI0028DEBE57|nr:hypothetical protein [Clostridium sp. 19966]MDT8719583.1 hypothetical protein [Clostridium sp. 19966]